MEKYDHKKIEAKWQKFWAKQPKLFQADDKSRADKQYILDMFPYPSSNGLHAGHVESYTATDIISRYLRMKGKNVLHPQGWDAFGLPAENYAVKTKTHPKITTEKAIENFTKQMKMMGFSYDWSREVNSSDPDYYKWTQWFFLLLYRNGLAYKNKAKVNWCGKCHTVLANEQAEGGVCDRCKNPVSQKDLEQWFFKITDFIEPSFAKATEAEKRITSGLLDGLDKVDWPESTKAAQKNWIGKSAGAEFELRITNCELRIRVYTTRLDTVFGMTYAVIAPEHKLIQDLKNQITNWPEVEEYINQAKKKTELQRMADTKEKTGVKLEGVELINPFNNETIPVFAADYVLAHYGTGAVMAVPAHDERDFEFAKKYNLPIKNVIVPYWLDQKNPAKADKETEKREVVCAIVKNPKDNKYLCLKWSITGWQSFPTGGIDGGGLVGAALREIKEETGYKNLKFVKQIPGSTYAEFYRPHKGSNVIAHFYYLIFDLENEEKEIVDQNEKDRHEAVWIPENEIESFINVENQQFAWKKYFHGDFAYCDDGILVESGEYNGLTSEEAREKITAWLEEKKIGFKKVNYKIRDWLVSRQRYWGAPIPIIYCAKCGEVAVKEKDLPVKLPTDVDFMPTGESPLMKSKSFHKVKCPKCGGAARREADTMDTFVCSSLYYFRYSDPNNKKAFADKAMIKKYLPVDLYVGGAEHTVLHLLYSRFFTKVLHNLGYIDFDEPFKKLRHQGIILAEDGRKMSKSLGNVVNPDDVVKQYGADALRLFEMFMGPLEDMKPWNTKGIIGQVRFLEKIWKMQYKVSSIKYQGGEKKLELIVNKTIKKVTEDIENLRFNTAISALMILANVLEKEEKIYPIHYTLYLILLSPFAPHLAEELWSGLGYKQSIFKEKWPEYDPVMVKDETINLVIQINGKVRDMIEVSADISENEAKKIALASEKIIKWLEGKEVVKIIFIKGKLINIVI
ncbi:MAG: class I tRNA ligase family protein [Patescibacteria group bacterium]